MKGVIAGRYRLGAELGRGGMARVMAARDLRLDRIVAVKLVPADPVGHADPAARARFVREARSSAGFSHPHAVSVFDAGEADGYLYLVMELVDGPSLATLIAGSRLDGAHALRTADQILQALAAAHRAGIVHRDVKPGNVLFTGTGDAKLGDFGIAKRLDDLSGDVTSTGQFVGTPDYLAPEQLMGGPVTAAVDVYSTGVLLFEMLTGVPPYAAASPVAVAIAHRDEPVPDLRSIRGDVPSSVAAVVTRAMAKDPADRFRSADEMRSALSGGPVMSPVAAVVPTPAPATRLPRTSVVPVAGPPRRDDTEVLPGRSGRRARSAVLAGTLVAAVIVGLALAAAGRGGDDPASGTSTSLAVFGSPTTTAAPTTAPPPTAAPTTAAPTALPPPLQSLEELLLLLEQDPGGEELYRELERLLGRDGDQSQGSDDN